MGEMSELIVLMNEKTLLRYMEMGAEEKYRLRRCKDCKWWEHYEYADYKYSLCGNPDMMHGDSMIRMDANDYCSKAEKK